MDGNLTASDVALLTGNNRNERHVQGRRVPGRT